jgi:hypothetical protein
VTEEVLDVTVTDRKSAREFVQWVEETVPLMGTTEYLEWFDGPERVEYIAAAHEAGLEASE